jgi:hypothetical protein
VTTKTKKVVCPAPGCQEYRRHHEDQDTPRGPQHISVPEDWTPDKGLAWCSMTCAMYAGAMSASNPQPTFWKTFLERHQDCGAHFHGEGDPSDLILEMRPTKDAQNWLVIYRPDGHADNDKVRNGMCWEMLQELRNN